MSKTKVWRLCEALNVRVASGHRPAQAQEMTTGMEAIFPFLSGPTENFCETEKKYCNFRVLAGCFGIECEKVVVLGIRKRSCEKVCTITESLRSQTKVWKLATLP